MNKIIKRAYFQRLTSAKIVQDALKRAGYTTTYTTIVYKGEVRHLVSWAHSWDAMLYGML